MRKTLVVLDPALKRGFTSIPNCVLNAPGLSLAAKAMYAILLSFAWENDESFPGKQALAQAAGVDVQTVIEEIVKYDEKRVAGALAAVQQYGQHNRVDNLYGLLLEALRDAWQPGPRAGPPPAGKNKPRPGSRGALEKEILCTLHL